MRKPQIFWEITTLDLSYVVMVKSTVEISQNFVAFLEYMNFIFKHFGVSIFMEVMENLKILIFWGHEFSKLQNYPNFYKKLSLAF